MTDPILNDSALSSASFALDQLAKRQELIGRNLANIDTPGFKAQTLQFENVLRQTIDKSDNQLKLATTNSAHLLSAGQSASVQVADRQGGSERADGNNVDLDIELNQMTETGIRYQAVSQMVSKKLLLLKTIAR